MTIHHVEEEITHICESHGDEAVTVRARRPELGGAESVTLVLGRRSRPELERSRARRARGKTTRTSARGPGAVADAGFPRTTMTIGPRDVRVLAGEESCGGVAESGAYAALMAEYARALARRPPAGVPAVELRVAEQKLSRLAENIELAGAARARVRAAEAAGDAAAIDVEVADYAELIRRRLRNLAMGESAVVGVGVASGRAGHAAYAEFWKIGATRFDVRLFSSGTRAFPRAHEVSRPESHEIRGVVIDGPSVQLDKILRRSLVQADDVGEAIFAQFLNFRSMGVPDPVFEFVGIPRGADAVIRRAVQDYAVEGLFAVLRDGMAPRAYRNFKAGFLSCAAESFVGASTPDERAGAEAALAELKLRAQAAYEAANPLRPPYERPVAGALEIAAKR